MEAFNMRRMILGVLVISAALAGGCAGTGAVYYADGSGTLTATTVAPDLVAVGPGVQVVADYDYPVFYADNYYWRYDNGVWFRSGWYTGGWVYATPPRAVLHIDRPYAYRHYRPAGYVARRSYVRDHRDTRPVYRESRPVDRESRPVVSDHRQYRSAPGAAPVVRDHRAAPVVRDHRAAPAPERRVSRDRRGDRARDRDHR
jgi:hypothetical protein